MTHRLFHCFLLPFSVLMLFACAPIGEHCARLPDNGRYCLIAGPWPEFTDEQSSLVTLKGKSMRMIIRIAANENGVRFAGLSPFGQTLFQSSWENSVLRTEFPPVLEGRLDPAFFPALLQIATWPAERVRKGLSIGLELIEDPSRRILRDATGDVMIISWQGDRLPYSRLRIEMPTVNLLIDSRTLEDAQ